MTSTLQIEAHIVADSISTTGARITTVQVTIHRFMLPELNTHRVFSRNSASSRAIPVKTQLERIEASPAFPISWPFEKPGMQGGGELEGKDLAEAQALFTEVHAFVMNAVKTYVDDHPEIEHRLHKSVLNRLLEPFMWHTVVITSTEWDNFFGLRCSPLAQPEIRRAAELIKVAYDASTPVKRSEFSINNEFASWHLPYITLIERASLPLRDLQKISVARCARVSSLHAGDARDYEQDYRLVDSLTSAFPPHASPLEHVAVPCDDAAHHEHANFEGWHQLRHFAGWNTRD